MSTATRPLRVLSVLAALGAVMVPAATPAPAAARGLVASLSAPSHHPKANRPFPIRITARNSRGKPVRADVRYEYLYGGQVVARRSHYFVKGTFRDTLDFPSRSVGIRLVFRAVVHSRIGTRNLDWWVEVRR